MIYKNIVCVAAIFAAGMLPAHVMAQEEVKDTTELDGALRNIYQIINLQEIRVKGAIGSLIGDQLYFVDDTGRYKVELDAGRDIRRQIDGCEIAIFGPKESLCQLSGMAEIAIDTEDDNIGDGFEISLILYRVDSFERRED